jgi:hypothetical protein
MATGVRWVVSQVMVNEHNSRGIISTAGRVVVHPQMLKAGATLGKRLLQSMDAMSPPLKCNPAVLHDLVWPSGKV